MNCDKQFEALRKEIAELRAEVQQLKEFKNEHERLEKALSDFCAAPCAKYLKDRDVQELL